MNDDNAPETRDAFELVGQEGRIARTSRMIAQNESITDARKEEIRRRVKEYIAKHDIHQSVLARECHIAKGTVSEVLRGVFTKRKNKRGPADDTVHLRGMNNWMELHARRQNIIQSHEFVETSVAREIIFVAETVAETCKMGVVYGHAQIGKSYTLAALENEARLGNPKLIRVDESCRTPRPLAARVCHAFQVPFTGTLETLTRRLIAQLEGTKRMLMFDEVERCTYKALEFIRDLHDQTGCPVLLAGKPAVRDRLGVRDLGDYREVVDQLSSRIVIRRDLTERTRKKKKGSPGTGGTETLFSRDDIRQLINMSQLELRFDSDAIDWLVNRASMIGMGGIGKTRIYLYLAFKVCRASGDDRVTVPILESIEDMTLGFEDAKVAEERATDPGRRKIRRYA